MTTQPPGATPPPKIAKHAESDKPPAKAVLDFHTNADTDGSPKAVHHTLGPSANQAASGAHTHDGGSSPIIQPLAVANVILTGSRANLSQMMDTIIPALVALGAVDNTTP